MKGLPNSADLRAKLHQVKSFSEVEGIFETYLRFYDEYVERGLKADDPDISSLTCEAA